MIGYAGRGTSNPSPDDCPDCLNPRRDCTCGQGRAVPVTLTLAVAGWTLRKRAGDLVDAGARVLFAGLATALIYTLYLAVSAR